jgi:MazG family protein
MGQNESARHRIEDLAELIRTLRGPGGCPWDKSRTLKDIKEYLLEECYEVIDALDRGSLPKLEEELGDLLFQIMFLVRLAEEMGAFDLQGVIQGIMGKMIRRHPHVFGGSEARDVEAVRQNWSSIKRREKGSHGSLLAGVPRALPALQRAYRLGKRAARVGFDWPDPSSVTAKVSEECEEVKEALARGDTDRIAEELGDLLFSIAQLARSLRINPEEALQTSNDTFVRRFCAMEESARGAGKAIEELSPAELDELWEKVKREAAHGR